MPTAACYRYTAWVRMGRRWWLCVGGADSRWEAEDLIPPRHAGRESVVLPWPLKPIGREE